MSIAITASTVCRFRETGSQVTTDACPFVLSIKADGTDDDPKCEKVQPGNEVFFLVTKSDNVELERVTSTVGPASFIESIEATQVDYLQFNNSLTASSTFPILTMLDRRWVGSAPQPTSTVDYLYNEFTLNAESIAVMRIEYTYTADRYRLRTPGDPTGLGEAYPIIVCADGVASCG